jgi:hypothetical protein
LREEGEGCLELEKISSPLLAALHLCMLLEVENATAATDTEATPQLVAPLVLSLPVILLLPFAFLYYNQVGLSMK